MTYTERIPEPFFDRIKAGARAAATVVVGAQVVKGAATAGPKAGTALAGEAETTAAGAGQASAPPPPSTPAPTAPAEPAPSNPDPTQADEGMTDDQSRERDRRAGELVPVKFSRLTRRGVLLGLSVAQLGTLGIGGLTLIGAFYAAGRILHAYTAHVRVLCATLTWIPVGGRPVVEWLPVTFWWLWRVTGGQLLCRRRIVRPRPVGPLALPGDMARLREYADPESGACMIHNPHAATLTVVCEVTHPAFVLLDPGEQERRVTTWAVRRRQCAAPEGRDAASPQTHPARFGHRVGGVVDRAWNPGRFVGRRHLRGVDRVCRAGRGTARHYHQPVAGYGGRRQAGQDGRRRHKGCRRSARQEMSTLVSALRSADLAPSGWLDAGQIGVILRSAYDPAVASALERRGQIGRDLPTAGPVAVTETWGNLRIDSANHAVLWISEWPRSLVYPGSAAPVLFSTGIQRAVSLIYTPMRSDQAAPDIRRKVVEYISDATQRARLGQIEDAAQSAEFQDVLQQEADLTAGHGVLRATGLISVSALSIDDLEAAVATITQAAIQAPAKPGGSSASKPPVSPRRLCRCAGGRDSVRRWA